MWELGESIGLDRGATSSVVDYLSGERLLEYIAMGGEIGITHYGIVEVERALSEPEKPTQYFPPVVNITHVHSMVNSLIQQGTHGSHQSFNATQNDMEAIRRFVSEFADRIETLGLSSDTVQEARSEIASVQAQLDSPKPKLGIISEGLRSIRAILEGAAANAVASNLLPQLLPLLSALGSVHPETPDSAIGRVLGAALVHVRSGNRTANARTNSSVDDGIPSFRMRTR